MLRKIFCFCSLILLLASTSCGKKQGNSLNLATAANMQFAIEALAKKFSEQSQIPTEVILGSSGKLTSQIKAGAPYHLFISADMTYPRILSDGGFTQGVPKAYATGRLVLWTYGSAPISLGRSLLADSLQHLAIANPKTAPYGKAALETLESLGLINALEGKLVYGESIAQTNQFITSGAAEAGFTTKAAVLSSGQQGKGFWVDVPAHLHQPITQGVVLLNNRTDMSAEAQEFYDFLFSDAAKEILNKFGYTSAN
jgi:molybdate transport system substrate-binding protein